MGEVVRPPSPDQGDQGRRGSEGATQSKLSLTPESKATCPSTLPHRASRDRQSQSVSSLCPNPL